MKKNRDEEEFHPAYGLISFHRVSGGGKVFFGSDVPSDHYITMQVKRAGRRHDLGQDWIGETSANPLIEVAMTYHQFAELLTSMNVGSGIPCTIQYFENKMVERLKEEKPEATRVRKYFEKCLDETNKELNEQIQKARVILAKDKISKQDRKALESILGSIEMENESNRPFYLNQFQEATEKMVVQAKAEVDAFITHAIVKTGLESLREGSKALSVAQPVQVAGKQEHEFNCAWLDHPDRPCTCGADKS